LFAVILRKAYPRPLRYSRSKRELHPDIQYKSNRIPIALKIFYGAIWIACLATFIYFVSRIAGQLIRDREHPPSRLILEQRTNIDLPAVAICNWNSYPSNNLTEVVNCDYCQVSLVQCLHGFDDLSKAPTNCISDFQFKYIHTDIESTGATYLYESHRWGRYRPALTLFSCYEFNAEEDDALTTNKSGYANSYALLFALNKTSSPERSGRRGLQATFAKPGTLYPSKIASEEIAASPDFDTFLALTELMVVNFDGEKDEILSENFAVRATSVRLSADLIQNTTHGTFYHDFQMAIPH